MSRRAFNESLHREHFDELASLSEIRSAMDDVAGIDERIEAHLDALVLGGEVALRVAEQEVRPDQPWTLHAWRALSRRVARPTGPGVSDGMSQPRGSAGQRR